MNTVHQSKLRSDRIFHRRIRLSMTTTAVLLTLFAIKLFEVQAVRASGYSHLALSELNRNVTLVASRGSIIDANGIELARSVAANNIVVDQTQVSNPRITAQLLAPILKRSASDLEHELTGSRRYWVIARNATPATWQLVSQKIKEYNERVTTTRGGLSQRILGIYPERIYIREYPEGSLTAPLIGIVNAAGIGAAGLESSLQNQLAGTNGSISFANGAGIIIPGSEKIVAPAISGQTVQLTIDRDVQWVAQDAITKAVKSAHALSGTVIVMDPKTGEILAAATSPTFNPQSHSITISDLRNATVQDVYEPGSTGKVITYAAALEEGLITPTSLLQVPYTLKRANKVFKDHEKHPLQTLTATGALAVSSNTAAIKIGEGLTHAQLFDYLKSFGIGSSTNSGLLGESAGILPEISSWSDTSAPTFSFGQGYSVTSLQAISVMATIANNGIRVNPVFIKGYRDSSGVFHEHSTNSAREVVSPKTAQEVRQMLESVVSESGTAPSAAIPGYRVAGKTGTAMRYSDSCSCYKGYTASFIGFAPADQPKYVVSVVIQDPKGMHWGGYLAGPVFKRVMSFVLNSRSIPPTTGKADVYPLSAQELRTTLSKRKTTGKRG